MVKAPKYFADRISDYAAGMRRQVSRYRQLADEAEDAGLPSTASDLRYCADKLEDVWETLDVRKILPLS